MGGGECGVVVVVALLDGISLLACGAGPGMEVCVYSRYGYVFVSALLPGWLFSCPLVSCRVVLCRCRLSLPAPLPLLPCRNGHGVSDIHTGRWIRETPYM